MTEKRSEKLAPAAIVITRSVNVTTPSASAVASLDARTDVIEAMDGLLTLRWSE